MAIVEYICESNTFAKKIYINGDYASSVKLVFLEEKMAIHIFHDKDAQKKLEDIKKTEVME